MTSALLLWLPFDLVHDLGWTLIHFLWQGALLTVVLELALLFGRDARTRYNIAFATLLAMAIAPVATFLVVHTSPIQVAPLAALPSPWPALGTVFAGGDDTALASAILWLNWLVLAWLVGVVALSLRVAGGWYATRRLVHRTTAPLPAPVVALCEQLARRVGVTRPVRFLQSVAVQVPAVVGWLRPVLLMPVSVVTGFTPQQLEAVILHELAHIRRMDVAANLIQVVVETVLFYHPAVWWVSRRIRIERENCCDDLAVSLFGDALGYARVLTTLAHNALPAPAVAATGGILKQRIARLLGIRVKPGNASAVAVAAIALAVLAGCVAARSVSNAPQQASTASTPSQEERARMVANMERMRRESLEMAQTNYDMQRKRDEIVRIPDEAARKQALADANAANLATSSQRLMESFQQQLEDLQRQQDEIARIPDGAARKKAFEAPDSVNRQQLIAIVRRQQDHQRRRDEAQRIPDEAARQQASLALNPESRELQLEWMRLSQERMRLMGEAARTKELAELAAAKSQQPDETALKKAQTDQTEMMRQYALETMQLAQESSQQMDKIGRQREEARRMTDVAAREKFLGEANAVDRQAQLIILRRQQDLVRRQIAAGPLPGAPPRTPEEAARRKESADRLAVLLAQQLENLQARAEHLRLEEEAWRIPDEATRKKALAELAEARRLQMLETAKRQLENAERMQAMPLPVPPATTP